MVDIAVGQDDRLEGARPRAVAGFRTQLRIHGDLLTQIRRGAEQDPVGAIRADREGGLGSRGKSGRAHANGAAIRTVAIPLRETAAGARSEDFYQHFVSFPRASTMGRASRTSLDPIISTASSSIQGRLRGIR